MAIRPIVITPRTRKQNTLVTCGLGRHNNLVTRGFVRGFFDEVARMLHFGASGAKRVIDEIERIYVESKLIGVNDEPTVVDVHGSTKAVFSGNGPRVVVEALSDVVREKWDNVKITIKRIRRR